MADQERNKANELRRQAEAESERAEAEAARALAASTAATEANAKQVATLARSNFLLATSRFKEGRAAEANRLLYSVPNEHRNLEWYFARRQFEGSYMTISSHRSPVYSVVFTPDGKHILSAGANKVIKVWDAASGLSSENQRNWSPVYTT